MLWNCLSICASHHWDSGKVCLNSLLAISGKRWSEQLHDKEAKYYFGKLGPEPTCRGIDWTERRQIWVSFGPGVPSLQDPMPDDLTWNWYNNRCNALESSPNCPPTTPRSMEKLSSGPWCQKVQGLLLWTIRGWYCSSCDAGDGKLVEPTPCPCPCEQFPPGRFYWTLKISEYGSVSELMRFQCGVGVSP